ncbi:MAG: hypothetical protein HRT71_21585 [Flavobacteriales bacterium]|nr:hypothetical protein [Flavobacteriales bacterium]
MLILISGTSAFAQDEGFELTVSATIKNNETGKKITGAFVVLYTNGSKSGTIVTLSDGRFEFVLKENNEYLIDIGKAGLVGKKLAISTKNIPEENLEPGYTFGGFEIYLLKEREGLDLSFYKNNPVAKAYFDQRLGGFDYDQQYAKQVIQEGARIQENLDRLREEEAEEKARQADFDRRIAKADKYFTGKNYKSAIKEYEGALKVIPGEVYPQSKLDEIAGINKGANDALAAEQKKKEAYDKLIKEGDAAMASKNYEEAKSDYKGALNIKAGEAYPTGKLAEIDKLIANNAADLAAKKKLQEDYDKLIAAADQKFVKQDYPSAQKDYEAALVLMSSEAYPKSKIAEIREVMAAAASKLDAEKKKKEAYAALIAKADKFLGAKNYEEAKKNYKSALAVMGSEPYPKGKIAEIDKILGDNLANAEAEKATKAKFDGLIAEADRLLASKSYPAAKAKYEAALAVIPGKEYPTHKIEDINGIMADASAQELAAKNKKAEYEKFVKMADASLASKNYKEAISHYNEALSVSSSEAYPKTKIAEIEKILSDENALAAADAKKRSDYDKLIATADKNFGSKKYNEAEKVYKAALAMFPSEVYPEHKLEEIKGINDEGARLAAANKKKAAYDKLIASADAAFDEKNWAVAKKAYQDALALHEDEKYPNSKLADIQRAINAESSAALAGKQKQDKYDALIKDADGLFASKKYHESVLKFEAALGVIPGKGYPKTKIEQIENLMSKAEASETAEKNKRAAYEKLIAKGDELFDKKIYADASAKFGDASSMYPNEPYPKGKVAEIKKIQDENQLLKAEAEKKQADHDRFISAGDKAFDAKKFTNALSSFQAALSLFPNELYPKTKIDEINKLMSDKATAEAAAKKAAAEKKASYARLIASADAAAGSKDYASALRDYKSAKSIMPSEKYPPQKIAEIEKLLADKSLADAAKNKKQAEYDQLIASGDAFKDANNYAGAIADYQKALAIMPAEVYPKYKIEELNKLLADEKSKEADAAKNKSKYASLVSKGNQFFNSKNYSMASKSYTDALILFPAEKYPRERLAEIDKMRKAKVDAAAAATARKKAEVAASVQPEKLYAPQTASDREKFVQKLALEYPQGMTEEILVYKNKKVTRRIVVDGDKGYEYLKVVMNYGGVFYKKNNVDITRYTYETETKPRQ